MRLLHRLSYANVMATIAVFIALGGASYAATNLPNNSVGAAQLKKGAVSAVKLKASSVTSAKLAKESVTGGKIKLSTVGTVPSAQFANAAGNSQTLTGLTAAQVINQGAAQGAGASKLRCASGDTTFASYCYSNLHPASNWYEAIDTCAKEGKTLPTPAQVHAFGKALNTGPQQLEWTGNALSTTTALQISATISGEGASEGAVFSTPGVSFHCVGLPTN